MALEIRTLAATYYGGHHIPPHAHPWGQLIYAAEGVMRVHAGDNLWVVPPRRAVWAPPMARHEIIAQDTFAMRTLYIAPRLCRLLGKECGALDVGPLLRELILHIVDLGMLDGTRPKDRRLAVIVIDQLRSAAPLLLSIRVPRDRRARAIADRLQNNPSDNSELETLASASGASARTIQRRFRAETGLKFNEWRRRLRLLHAVTLLNSGSSVTQAGFEAGYHSTSAFIAAFRAELGMTPARLRASAAAA
jgi:AraC-like DNA-binding protein